MTDPAVRSVVGIFALLALIAAWAVIVASFSMQIGRLWMPLQIAIYIAAGLAWIYPARPIMRWIVTGRWRS
jgi:predicted membrane channel-forming protein YqfA (hemolysin III family)